jgi:hypothetical protein
MRRKSPETDTKRSLDDKLSEYYRTEVPARLEAFERLMTTFRSISYTKGLKMGVTILA